jgi:hypothetical protein
MQAMQRHKLKLLIALLVVLVVAIAYVYYLFFHAPPDSGTPDVDFELPEGEEEEYGDAPPVAGDEPPPKADPLLQRIDASRHA